MKRLPSECLIALGFAFGAHSGQVDRSGEPYINHPTAVAHIVNNMGGTLDEISAALLHDVIEDTRVGYTDIKRAFGHQVANLVLSVSKLAKPPAGPTYKEWIAEIANSREIGSIRIKIADIIHNSLPSRQVGSEDLKGMVERRYKPALKVLVPVYRELMLERKVHENRG